jgi:hypothetical protein
MADNKLTEREKSRFVDRVMETLLPLALRDMFESEIRNVWNSYVKTLAPGVPEDMFWKTHFYLNTAEEELSISITDCYYIDAPYIDGYDLDQEQCPCQNLKMAVTAYVEYREKRNKLRILLEGKMLTINTRKALKEELPQLYKYFDDGAYGAYMPVAIDIDQLDDCVVAV